MADVLKDPKITHSLIDLLQIPIYLPTDLAKIREALHVDECAITELQSSREVWIRGMMMMMIILSCGDLRI